MDVFRSEVEAVLPDDIKAKLDLDNCSGWDQFQYWREWTPYFTWVVLYNKETRKLPLRVHVFYISNKFLIDDGESYGRYYEKAEERAQPIDPEIVQKIKQSVVSYLNRDK